MNAPDVADTIVAIASAPGLSLRGIVRVSGPSTLDQIEPLFVLPHPIDREKNSSQETSLTVEHNGCFSRLPGQLLSWPTTKSYTRQPTVEFHTLGSRPLLDLVVKKICEMGGRLAQPGEFTLRAFLSGRIDLTHAEAVLDVIDSTSQNQLQRALGQLTGGLAGPLTKLQDALVDLLAELEAGLDFVEEDIEFISRDDITQRLADTSQSLDNINRQLQSRRSTNDIPVVALIGLPNAGKSSLFNSLVGKQHAIVSQTVGTTRDCISTRIKIGSQTIELIDTAGIDRDDSQSEIDSLAQQHAIELANHADLKVLCLDRNQTLADSLPLLNQLRPNRDLIALTKSDLNHSGNANKSGRSNHPDDAATNTEHRLKHQIANAGWTTDPIDTSSVTNAGIDPLKQLVASRLLTIDNTDSPIVQTTAERTASCLDRAAVNIHEALEAARHDLGQELVAAEIRQSLHELSEVLGKIYTDDILDRIFSRFCIGK